MDLDQYNRPSAGQTSRGAFPLEKSGTPIRDALCNTESLASDLHQAIAALEERFATVLVPDGPMPAGNLAGKDSPVKSDLRQRLDDVNRQIRQAVERLQHFGSRADV